MAVLTGIVGVCVASMIVAVIVQKISLSHSEERLNKFLAKSKNEKSVGCKKKVFKINVKIDIQIKLNISIKNKLTLFQLKITAATVLKESWLLYKNRKAGDQVFLKNLRNF